MTERDELAKLIFITDNSNAPDPEAEWREANEHPGEWGPSASYAWEIADGLLAAGYRKVDEDTPRTDLAEAFDWGVRNGQSRAMRKMSDQPELSLEVANPYRKFPKSDSCTVSGHVGFVCAGSCDERGGAHGARWARFGGI